MRKISLRSRIAIVFTIVVTIVLILAAISFSYFCRLHFERKDPQVLVSKAYAIENVLLTMEAPYNRIAVPINHIVDNSYAVRSEEHPSELQSLMRISHVDICLTKK